MRNAISCFVIATLGSGCAGLMEKKTRKTAAQHFPCAPEKLELEVLRKKPVSMTFDVQGCGWQATYISECNIMGMCSAETEQGWADHNYEGASRNAKQSLAQQCQYGDRMACAEYERQLEADERYNEERAGYEHPHPGVHRAPE